MRGQVAHLLAVKEPAGERRLYASPATAAIVLLPVALPHPGKLLKRGAARDGRHYSSVSHMSASSNISCTVRLISSFHACWRRC